ncbi:hypothetical protein [Frateuria soli]|uniref:hypothetical protein n=1 Tax=Frateuria soli TaxID=1542730 RepID=UPI001E3894D6|nr:hypothetical protein [Frateuria soli]UGB39637.1 hypothetical protein LQ771_07355 [Frateuria soli]
MNPIAAGRTFPDFVLPDHIRTPRRLSDPQGTPDLMLLALIRGLFCPKDREQLNSLTAWHRRLVVGSCHRLVTRDRSDPELKRQWDTGDKSNFHFYGVKPMERTLVGITVAMDRYAGFA